MTAPSCCPRCGHRIASDAEAVEAKLGELRLWLRDRGHWIGPGDLITEQAAADALGRKPKTLRNLRGGAAPIPYRRVRGSIRYELADVAAALVD